MSRDAFSIYLRDPMPILLFSRTASGSMQFHATLRRYTISLFDGPVRFLINEQSALLYQMGRAVLCLTVPLSALLNLPAHSKK